jgi:hypothetical protein
MTAAISKEERALIDAAIAEGNITRIPTGACSETRYRWCPNMSSLVPVEGMDMSWRNQERNRAKRRFRQYELPPHIIARRKKVVELVEQRKSRSQIAEAIGCPVSQVAWDIKVMGLSTANSERVCVRRQSRFRQSVSGKRNCSWPGGKPTTLQRNLADAVAPFGLSARSGARRGCDHPRATDIRPRRCRVAADGHPSRRGTRRYRGSVGGGHSARAVATRALERREPKRCDGEQAMKDKWGKDLIFRELEFIYQKCRETIKASDYLRAENERLRAALASNPPHGIPPLGGSPLTMNDMDEMMAAADKLAVKTFPVDEERARIYRAISGADRAALRAVASQLGLTPRDALRGRRTALRGPCG